MNVACMYTLDKSSGEWRHLLRFFDVPYEPQFLPKSVPIYLVVNHKGRYPVDDAIPLPEFTHPECATYIFGDDDGGPLLAPNEVAKVTIPTEYGLGLFAVQAGAIVLYDRMAKRWRS